MLSTSRASITALSRTLQNSESFLRSSFGIGRSVRQSRMSGWMPIESSSFTECCVGLVFNSPALVAELADRLEERQALDVADRAADLHQHEVAVLIAVADEVLDGVGDVRDHLDGGAEVIAAPFLGEDVLINAA